MMINTKTIATTATLLVIFMAMTEARLNGRKITDAADEMHLALRATRKLRTDLDVGNTKTGKNNKFNHASPSAQPTDIEVSELTSLPTGPPTASPTTTSSTGPPTSSPTDEAGASPTGPPTTSPTEMPSMPPATQTVSSPTSQPTLMPASKPSAAPIAITFDSTIEVSCQPDGDTALTPEEASTKTIICNPAKPSCREAVTAVKESADLQNFFGCAGDLGEGAARKLFNQYASSDILAGQLTLVATTKPTLITERPDAMKATCMAIGMAQSPPAIDPCCQGSSGCTSATGSASDSPPFMTIAVTACTGDSACKDMGPNPLILDSSCTGVSACELMNENEINPFITGVTFVGEMACTSSRSCEGVGRRSHGDVTIQPGACIGSEACNSAGRRVEQSGPSFRFRSHIHIGSNACVGSNACKDAHSTVNHGTGGKLAGSLAIGDGGCAADGSCEKMGFNDRMKTDIIVPPGGCSTVESCRGCMTNTECAIDEVYLISDVDGACPKGGSDTNYNPTGDKVDEYCVGKDTLPTDCPTFSPTPFPTPLTSSPTSSPTNLASAVPSAQPIIPRTSLEVGCLAGPGDTGSTFNIITTGEVFCDGTTDTCTEFVAAIDSLGDKGKMIKSIFGCNDEATPNIVTLDVAQKRFNKIKNDASVTNALLDTVATMKLYTGSGPAVSAACNGSCCDGSNVCTTLPTTGVMTVSDGSCNGSRACGAMRPDTIILESCSDNRPCEALGWFSPIEPAADVEVGYRVIGPRACNNALHACISVGKNVFGNIRVEEGACIGGTSACNNLGSRTSQGATTSPIVANIFIGKNACQGTFTCNVLHAEFAVGPKIAGNLIVEEGACIGEEACVGLANNNAAVNDILIKKDTCTPGNECKRCAQAELCGGDATKTYVIDDASDDCPGPNPNACEVL